MIDLLIKYPTRSRPEKFKEILQKYVSMLSGKHKIKFIISMDKNDETCNNENMHVFLETIKKNINLEYIYGTSKNKIDACNRDIPNENWKICILISDDMTPIIKNYDEIIINDMQKYFSDYDGCLNYNVHTSAFEQKIEGRGSLMVLSIMGKKYYDRFNYIYNPIYVSLFCDDEQTRVARKLKKIVDINHRIISHDWSSINDDLRKQTEAFDTVDRNTFKQRLKDGLI